MRVVVGILLVVAALFGEAHADADARARAARARLALQIRALQDGKLDAFAAMFPDTQLSAVMFPSSRFASVGRKAIREAATEWAGVARTRSTLGVEVVGTPVVSQRGDHDTGPRSEKLVVVTADLEITQKGGKRVTLRATGVLVEGLDPKTPKALVATALFITEPIEERALRGESNLGESSELDRFLDLLRVPDLLAARFDGGADDFVIDVHDRAVGSDAKKLLARWHTRKLALVGKPHVAKGADWVYAMATVSMARTPGKPAPLGVLLVGYPECKASCVGTDMTPHVVAIHVGQPR